jgi:hypothetical protein
MRFATFSSLRKPTRPPTRQKRIYPVNTDNRSKALGILIGLQNIRCPARFEFLRKPFIVEIHFNTSG